MGGTFWRSFLNGLTLEGMFGDLRVPEAPTRLFKTESMETLMLLLMEDGAEVRWEEIRAVEAEVRRVVDRMLPGRAVVSVPESTESVAR